MSTVPPPHNVSRKTITEFAEPKRRVRGHKTMASGSDGAPLQVQLKQV